MVTVRDILERNARLHPRKVGLIDGDKRFTYSEIDERANRLCSALNHLGLKKGDKIAIMAHNCHEYVEFYFAIAKGGYVAVPINARLTATEVAYNLNHSESIAFIYHEALEDQIEVILKNKKSYVPNANHIITIGKERENTISFNSLLDIAPYESAYAQVEPDDLFMILYTSGTTGIPKGVMISHRNIVANTNSTIIEKRIVPEDINLLVLPLFHIAGFWPLTTHFYRSGLTILLPRFDAEKILQTIEKEKVTFLNLVPTMLQRLITHPGLKDYDLSSLRFLMYAGAPSTVEQIKEAMSILGQHIFYTGLGCTEAGMITNFPGTEHYLEGPLSEKLGSVGKDGINVEVKIVDNEGVELPPGKVGEIIVKGDNVSLGYWKMPQETAKTYKNGWLYTGDLGYRDDDGYIFHVDRKKDIIISGGENVSSREVESIIYQHPAVKEVAVIGIPDKEWGESVRAIVSLKPHYKNKVSEQDIMDFCRQRLAGFKRPKKITFLDELPKNSVGKISKAELRKLYR